MAQGNDIIVSAPHRGVHDECIISGTPKPGTWMQIKAATEPVAGRYTYEAYAPGSDGDEVPMCILLADKAQGKLSTTAYADGDRGFLYFPVNGERLNVLAQDVSGTGDDHAIGDLLIGDSGTGKFIADTGTPECKSFQVLETVTDPTADHLIHARFVG